MLPAKLHPNTNTRMPEITGSSECSQVVPCLRSERRAGSGGQILSCFPIPASDKIGGIQFLPVCFHPVLAGHQAFSFGLLASGGGALALTMLLCASNWAPPLRSVKLRCPRRLTAGLRPDPGTADLTEGQRRTNRQMEGGGGGGGVWSGVGGAR